MKLTEVEESVFENRNKAYGAYDLRLRYAGIMSMALAFTGTATTILFIMIFFALQKRDDLPFVDYRTKVLDIKTEKILGLPIPKSMPLQQVPKTEKAKLDNSTKEIIKTPTKKDEEVATQTIHTVTSAPIPAKGDQSNASTGGKAGDSTSSYAFERLITASEDTMGTEEYTSEIYFNVDQDAMFPGGNDSLYSFLYKKIIPPEYALQKQVKGIVYLLLLVEATGKISEYKVYRGIETACDASVMEAIKHSPNWIPARKKGKKVRQRLVVGIPYNYGN